MKQPLPIDALQDGLVAACGRVRRLVLRAPTGSGKSTRIPQMLLDLNLVQGQIVVLQPRRIAARLLAARIAQEREVRLGGEVGYQIRFERVESAQTRIKFVTEALLLRQMASDPQLKGIGAVVTAVVGGKEEVHQNTRFIATTFEARKLWSSKVQGIPEEAETTLLMSGVPEVM